MKTTELEQKIVSLANDRKSIPNHLVSEAISSKDLGALHCIYRLFRSDRELFDSKPWHDCTSVLYRAVIEYLCLCVTSQGEIGQLEQEGVHSRYEATHVLSSIANEVQSDVEALKVLFGCVVDMFKNNRDVKIRLAIETGFLEHVGKSLIVQSVVCKWFDDSEWKESVGRSWDGPELYV
jgi:hypothetical protein